MSLATPSCFVLGGGGFIGTNLCQALVARGHRVAAFGRSRLSEAALAGVEWHQGDYPDAPRFAGLLAGFDVLVHLVHSSTPAGSNADMEGDLRDNLLPAIELMRLARDAGVKRFIYASSGGTIYGRQDHVPIPETAPTDPLVGYGVCKLAIEKYLAIFCHVDGLDYRVLRFANLYGPHHVPGALGIVPVLIQRALGREPMTIWGDGRVVRDFLYVADAVEATIAAIVKDSEGRIFNVGSGTGLSVRQVIAEVEAQTGRKMDLKFEPGRKADVPVSILSVERARQQLGWQPATSFSDGIARTLAWWQTSMPAGLRG